MSQRGRPSSTQSPSNQQRMPIEAAEALLWGRETHNEHIHLYGRMKELEEQHRDYDARIQATETIVEAAEAATARVRRIEQQVAAIESDEQDRPFDKWVEGEISGFKNFIEQNKGVRQKQIELEDRISHVEDSVDKVTDPSKDVEILLERITRLECDQISNANRIRSLETDVTNLTLLRQGRPVANDMLPRQTIRQQIPKPMMPPPSKQPIGEVQDDSETEDEHVNALNLCAPMQQGQQQIQVPRSPEINALSNSLLVSSPSKGAVAMSARIRMMQRKSIHEPKKPRELEPRQPRAPDVGLKIRPGSQISPLPPTQIVNRWVAGMSTHTEHVPSHIAVPVHSEQSKALTPEFTQRPRLQAELLPATQIVSKPVAETTSYDQGVSLQTAEYAPYAQLGPLAPGTKSRPQIQASNLPATRVLSKPANLQNASSLNVGIEQSEPLAVKLPTQKRKSEEDVPIARLTRSQAKKSQDVIPSKLPATTTQKIISPAETQAVKGRATKRRKINDIRALPQPQSMAPDPAVTNGNAKVSRNAAILVKTSPRKAAIAANRQSCNSCKKAHTLCDHARPSCGSCQKRPQRGVCVYVNSPTRQTQLATQISSSPRKKQQKDTVRPSVLPKQESPTKSGGSKTMGANRRTSPGRSSMSRKTPSTTSAGIPATSRHMRPPPSNARTVMPSFEDYKHML